MRMTDLLERKRDGGALSTAEIREFIAGVTAGTIPDYQVAAMLMAITIRGMSRRETVDLTLAMAGSGDTLDLHDLVAYAVDKHSSGGVGDKTTLVVQPLVAAAGVPVAKMSGRGLGSSGGTLDKMESFPGWSPDLTLDQFRQQLAESGLVLAGQTAALAPADGKLYALRDVTGTVPSIPLIAASIMSKKLASGADGIVLDVKVGSGAFVETIPAGRELAQTMVHIGLDAGRQTVALLSDMNQPLGQAIGNALEVKEAIATLRGGGPADFSAHCREIAAHMLTLAGKAPDVAAARDLAQATIDSGAALAQFRVLVDAQGGDSALVDDPTRLPQARIVIDVPAPRAGYVAAINTGEVGWSSVLLGAGRQVKGDKIDHAVGYIMPLKVGDYLEAGAPMLTIHANDEERLAQAQTRLLPAISWSDEPVAPLPHFHGVIGG